MKLRLPAYFLLLLLAPILLHPTPARAGCSVVAQNIPFGALAVDALQGAAIAGALTLSCPPGLPTSHVGLCVKITANGANRTMKNAAGQSISYGLYHDPSHSIPWSGATETVFVSAPYDTNAGAVIQQPIYAKILSTAAGLSKGSYSDAVSAQAVVAGEGGYDGMANVCNGVSGSRASLTFNATADMQPSCSVSASDMTFPDGLPPTTDVTAVSQLTIACTGGTYYEVGLSAGAGAGATISARKMTGPNGGTITYSLYKDASNKQVWGDMPGFTSTGSGDGVAQTLRVYGLAPRQPAPTPGRYADVINVIVSY
jgi:spore coat protein U-like protein